MESVEPKDDIMTVPYDSSPMDDSTFETAIDPVQEEKNDDPVVEDQEAISSQLYSPQMKLNPQLLEDYYINLARTSETNIQELAQYMHGIVNDIVAEFETIRQETLEANLATCRSLIVEIQQMESEQEVMKYQIELYMHKVRQAHEQVFSKNTTTK